MLKGIDVAFIDLFCGAGGTTSGIKKAGSKVFLCINHDEMAIESHKANDKAIHLVEDIRKANISEIARLCRIIRTVYPDIMIHLWASAECTNFSKAKGGLPRDADSRSLVDYVLRNYVEQIRFEAVFIENVVEFMAWGPLDEKGKPVSKKNGEDYVRWVEEMKASGNYQYDYKILNAADFGAYTSRIRYFGQFVDQSMEIAWPEPTHAKKPMKGSLLKKWKAVRDVLDLNSHGESIFNRKKPLVEKSLERIYAGLIKFVAGGKDSFMKKYNSGRPWGKVNSIDEPCGTLTTIPGIAVVTPQYLIQYNGKPKNSKYSVENPAGTLCSKDRFGLVKPLFILRDFSGGGSHQSLSNPSGSLTTIPKSKVVSAVPLVLNYNSSTAPVSGSDQPAPTVTCARTHYIINPQWFNTAPGDIDNPCHTLIARMDKAPSYLVVTESGEVAIQVFETDSPMTVKIKEFMALYGIADIRMRMLHISEMLKIQGFPDGYILKGTQTQQKKYIGNSVEVTIAAAIVRASIQKNKTLKSKAA